MDHNLASTIHPSVNIPMAGIPQDKEKKIESLNRLFQASNEAIAHLQASIDELKQDLAMIER